MILFLSQIIPEDMMKWYVKNSRISVPVSSETHQRAIIKGLQSEKDVFLVNKMPAGVYPIRFNRINVKRKMYDGVGVNIRTTTFPILRIVSYIENVLKECKKVINNKSVESILVYMPFYACSVVVKRIKKKYSDIPVVVIVPDLVRHSYRKDGNRIKVYIKKRVRMLQARIVNNNLKQVDGFIYLADKMKEEFGADRKYMVLEAIYEPAGIDKLTTHDIYKHTEKKKTITYCGKISDENGVKRLVNAFMSIENQEWRLMICGTGEILDELKYISREDSRVLYMGQVSHDDVIKYELQSDVLINPRYTYLENTAYSFPSKLIEYMACGKVVLSSRLPGIPSDYDDCLIYIEDDTEVGLRRSILRIMNLTNDELVALGASNRRFVERNKSTIVQGKKIIKFLEDVKREA